MQIDEIQHYFSEIGWVLKPGGLCFSTFFLYNSENKKNIATENQFSFSHKKEGFRLMHEDVKSGSIAIQEDKLKHMINEAKLEFVKIVDGFWKDDVRDKSKKEYHDIVVFRKSS